MSTKESKVNQTQPPKKSQSSSAKYLKALFKPGEGVGYCTDVRDTRIITLEEALELPAPQYISANPLHLGGRRADINCSAYRAWVIEMDVGADGNAVPLEEQLYEFSSKKLPYTTLTFSGSKSIHAVICVQGNEFSLSDYHYIFKLLRFIFPHADSSCKNPSRLTRAAGAHNAKTGAAQELIDSRRAISASSLYKWLGKFQGAIDRGLAYERSQIELKAQRALPLTQGETPQLDQSDTKFIQGALVLKSRHAYGVAFAYRCAQVYGLDEGQTEQFLNQAFAAYGILNRDEGEVSRILRAVFG